MFNGQSERVNHRVKPDHQYEWQYRSGIKYGFPPPYEYMFSSKSPRQPLSRLRNRKLRVDLLTSGREFNWIFAWIAPVILVIKFTCIFKFGASVKTMSPSQNFQALLSWPKSSPSPTVACNLIQTFIFYFLFVHSGQSVCFCAKPNTRQSFTVV